MNVSSIIWQAAGNPAGNGTDIGRCRLCGQQSIGMPFLAWVRDTFTDWDKILPGEIICHACQFIFAESSSLLASRVAKEKPQRMRNYSHFVVGGEWIPLSKAEKRRMTEILRGDFEVAVIADSGQKHIIFRAVPGIVQFEEQRVYDVHSVLSLLEPVQALYCGFSKDEIRTGRYDQLRIARFGISEFYKLERQIARFRGAVTLELALFLAQKEEENGVRIAQNGG